jgi:hypothetical protein
MRSSTLQLPDLDDARFRSVAGSALYHPGTVATRAFLQTLLVGLNATARLPSRSAHNEPRPLIGTNPIDRLKTLVLIAHADGTRRYIPLNNPLTSDSGSIELCDETLAVKSYTLNGSAFDSKASEDPSSLVVRNILFHIINSKIHTTSHMVITTLGIKTRQALEADHPVHQFITNLIHTTPVLINDIYGFHAATYSRRSIIRLLSGKEMRRRYEAYIDGHSDMPTELVPAYAHQTFDPAALASGFAGRSAPLDSGLGDLVAAVSAARTLSEWFVEDLGLDPDLGSDSQLRAWVHDLESTLQTSHIELVRKQPPRDALAYMLALGLICTYIHDLAMHDLLSEELVPNIPRTRIEKRACSAFMWMWAQSSQGEMNLMRSANVTWAEDRVLARVTAYLDEMAGLDPGLAYASF